MLSPVFFASSPIFSCMNSPFPGATIRHDATSGASAIRVPGVFRARYHAHTGRRKPSFRQLILIPKMNTRIEHDTFGPIAVPAEHLWGAQTQRSLQNFNISGERQPKEIIRALVQIKRSSAVVNHLMGLMDDRKASAIIAAADE